MSNLFRIDKKIKNLSKKDLYGRKGLLSLALLSIALSFAIFEILKGVFDLPGRDYAWFLSLIFVFGVVSFVLWWQINKIPRNEEKVGLFVSIETDSDHQRQLIENDFLPKLEANINNGGLKDLVNIVPLSNFHAEKVNKIIKDYTQKKNSLIRQGGRGDVPSLKEKDENLPQEFLKFKELKNNTNGHIFIYGSLKKRDKDKNYYFELDSLVSHKSLKRDEHEEFEKDLKDAFYRVIKFPAASEFKGVEFSSKNLSYFIRYILGRVVFLAKFPSAALDIHLPLKEDLNELNDEVDLSLNRGQFKEVLAEEFFVKAFLLTKRRKFGKAYGLLEKALENDPTNYPSLILKSKLEFDLNRNIDEALELSKKAKNHAEDHYEHLYNLAFLHFYKGNIEKGEGIYKKINQINYPKEGVVVKEVIDHIKSLLDDEDKPQLLFALGYLLYRKTGDLNRAKNFFREFLDKVEEGNQGDLEYLVPRARTYIGEIEKIQDSN